MADSLHNELQKLVLSRHKMIALHSTDEVVEFNTVLDVARTTERNVHEWKATTGIQVYSPDVLESATVGGTEKPELALQYLMRQRRPAIGCFRGLASFLGQPVLRQLLKDYYYAADSRRECLVLMDEETLHPRIQRMTVPWHPRLPDEAELLDIVDDTFDRMHGQPLGWDQVAPERQERNQFVQNLRGLTRTEAARVVETIILSGGDDALTDLQRLIDAKHRLLESSGVLESVTIDFGIDEVGGLAGLKGWLSQRRGAFTDKARDFGIEPPRGVLMLGVPGCGKSLCAKAVAADWGMPLLRLDPGLLYQKFVGESENQLRQAIRQAEAMAPVVLWIDEIEKAFASASASTADGGLSQRMFGTLLSWMQEHHSPIFTVATANDISALPPELMRKGRFDEVFFVDLPGVAARREIFSIHLKRKGRSPADFRLDELADASKDLTGAEIEDAIKSGLFAAFAEDRPLGTDDILNSIAGSHLLSALMHEQIDQLRGWANKRCVPAD